MKLGYPASNQYQEIGWAARMFDGMMHEFCVGIGFCGCVKDGKPLHVTDFIQKPGQFLRTNS
jgi:hypothetical protein